MLFKLFTNTYIVNFTQLNLSCSSENEQMYLKNLVRNSADLSRCRKLYDRIFTTNFVNTENITTRIWQKFLQILDVHLLMFNFISGIFEEDIMSPLNYFIISKIRIKRTK